jgi:hypothetical protein
MNTPFGSRLFASLALAAASATFCPEGDVTGSAPMYLPKEHLPVIDAQCVEQNVKNEIC